MSPPGPPTGGRRVALLGLGLVGGSIARALHADLEGGWSISAWSPTGIGPRVARDAGIVDEAAADAAHAVDRADLVVLAAPPLSCLQLLRDLAGPLRGVVPLDAIVTDVASTKATITAAADGLGVPFAGGHPMAGRETTGFAAADAALFRGRPWVVVPPVGGAGPGATEAVERLARACGARPVAMDALEHDRLVAAISHLPLVLSAALVEAVAGAPGDDRPDWPAAARLAAGGWDGMVRLARGDVEMGTGIAATNAAPLAARIRDVRAVLDRWLEALEGPEGPDADEIRERLEGARDRLAEED